jgi:serine/threonine protein kinase
VVCSGIYSELTFAGHAVKIVEEIGKTQKEVDLLKKEPEKNKNEIRALTHYIGALNIVLKQPPLGGCEIPLEDKTIRSKYGKQLRGVFRYAGETFSAEIPIKSLYDLVTYIETNKESWRKKNTRSPPSFQLETGTGDQIEVRFEVRGSKDGHIYLDFGRGYLGNGATKVFTGMTLYKNWTNVAKGVLKGELKSSPEAQRRFQKEATFLKKISAPGSAKNIGLPDTYHIGKGVIVQQMYDGNLSTLLFEMDDPDFTSEKRVQALFQLSQGLATFHGWGFQHRDIKLENILWRKYLDDAGVVQFEFAYADFDLSEDVRAKLAKSKNAGTQLRKGKGSPGYAAPEVFQREWVGLTEHDKLVNALKEDVFSQGVVAAILMKLDGRELPWDMGESFDFEDFKTDLDQLHRDTSDKRFYEALPMLIAASLRKDPHLRITSQQFKDGLDYILQQRQQSSHAVAAREEILSSNRAVVDLESREVEANLLGKPPGTYSLFPIKALDGPGYKVGLAYVDPVFPKHKPKFKELDIDLRSSSQLENEIGFLKGIGVLSKPFEQ